MVEWCEWKMSVVVLFAFLQILTNLFPFTLLSFPIRFRFVLNNLIIAFLLFQENDNI